MEHTPAGGCIQVSFSENAIFTEIIIEDNGPGFALEDLPHLFERFYKGKNASPQSVGIGLALARMVVLQQNGTLKAENRPEGGARFVIKFYPRHA
jgi:signal transduction histidine kinase